MRLTRFSDYSIRVLMHLATLDQGRASIAGIADSYGISHSHLMKVVQDLAAAGDVETLRGRGGGIRLARPADEINLGTLLRRTEGNDGLIDCSTCLIAGPCGLPGVLAGAMRAFYAELDRFTLADIIRDRGKLRKLFERPEPAE